MNRGILEIVKWFFIHRIGDLRQLLAGQMFIRVGWKLKYVNPCILKPSWCSGCKQVVDLDCCWCGNSIEDHGFYDGHSPVPIGCTCHLNHSVGIYHEPGIGK